MDEALVACGQAVVELPGKVKELVLTEGEALPNGLQHDIHNQLHRMGEGRIGQLIRHHVVGKTAKSILVSCGARLAVFDIEELQACLLHVFLYRFF